MSMNYADIQKQEIATIKERTITLNLSDADVKRICEKAGSVGLTVPQLLQNFIGDLVCGTYSNGSDERDYAQQWFERCYFGMFPESTFLRYAIRNCLLDDILSFWDDVQSSKDELMQDDLDPEEALSIKGDMEYAQQQIDDYFDDYKRGDKENQGGTFDEEMKKVLSWREDYWKMCQSSVEATQKQSPAMQG